MAATATNDASAAPPPGDRGLPLLGHTLSLLKGPHGFLADQRARHGRCFRARVLGRDVVFLSGPEAARAFLDEDNVTRERAHPDHLRDLFGGANMQMLSGPPHRALKSLALEAFGREALTSYLPGLQALVEATLDRLASAGEGRGCDEMRRLALEAIGLNVLGVAPGPDADWLRAQYQQVTAGMVSLPLPLPGTRFSRARRARDRVLAFLRRTVAARRASPGDDGISRMLAARAPDGGAFTDDALVLELHHIVIAGYIVFGLFLELLLRLHDRPDLRRRARDEVRREAPAGPLTLAALGALPEVGRLVKEAKRTAPVVPLAFGKARRAFAVEGGVVPAGWDVWWALSLANSDPAVFTDPAAFEPDRYAEGRAEDQRHEHAFVPQGSGPMIGHKCLGYDYSTVLTTLFTVILLRGYRWRLPEQDRGYFWNRIPAEPRDGLRLVLTRGDDAGA